MTTATTENNLNSHQGEEPLYSARKPGSHHGHVISALVENRPGVLAGVSSMFAARAFNITSLAVGTTEDPTVSRMTIVCKGDDRVVEQIVKQLRKLIDVIRVVDLRRRSHVERELILVKVVSTEETRSEIMQIVDIFRGRIIDVHHDSLVLEISGTLDKNNALLDLLAKFGITEMARTGRVALFRGPEALKIPEQ